MAVHVAAVGTPPPTNDTCRRQSNGRTGGVVGCMTLCLGPPPLDSSCTGPGMQAGRTQWRTEHMGDQSHAGGYGVGGPERHAALTDVEQLQLERCHTHVHTPTHARTRTSSHGAHPFICGCAVCTQQQQQQRHSAPRHPPSTQGCVLSGFLL